MEQAYQKIAEAVSYYVEKADRLALPEECDIAEELADKIWHLEEALEILKTLNDDGER